MATLRLAVIGDVHLQFDATDVAWFNSADYDALLFVGDFVARDPNGLFRILPHINALTKPVYIIPGNHDTTGLIQLAGEIMHNDFLSDLGAPAQKERLEKFRAGLHTAQLCGYSCHELSPQLEMVAARPFSMGGGLNFKKVMRDVYGIRSLADSTAAIQQQIAKVTKPYVILAHHGPFGLGSAATDIFGADFLPNAGDWGDRDLREAIDYSQTIGRTPLAVIAGHMHYPTKHGKLSRTWFTERNGILYINAARWPRIFRHEGKLWRHHVRLEIKDKKVFVVKGQYVSESKVIEIVDPLRCWP